MSRSFLPSLTSLVRFVVISLALCAVCLAQDAPGYMSEQGRPPFTTEAPVEGGFINLANGNLHLEIPIASIPERSGRQYTAHLVYDSRMWQVIQDSPSQQWHPTYWGNLPGPAQQTGNISVVNGPVTGWSLTTSFAGPNVTYTTTTQTYEDPAHGCYQDVVNSYTNFVASFPDGSKKYFPGLSTLNNPQPACIDGSTNKSTEYYHASDASGYYLYVTNYNQWFL